jgi:hypothetical protein
MGIPWENDAKTWRIDVLQMFRVNDSMEIFSWDFHGIFQGIMMQNEFKMMQNDANNRTK